ncbi:MAG: hypothetical protein IPG64_00925 [Haliea sp.]|nr:hypothetical protein [Haliea sp.]MBK6736531.1 hypothetical protein [Haliea sp.]
MKKDSPNFGNAAYFDSCHGRSAEIDIAMIACDPVRQQIQKPNMPLLHWLAGNESKFPYHTKEYKWQTCYLVDLRDEFVALRSKLKAFLSQLLQIVDPYVSTGIHERD